MKQTIKPATNVDIYVIFAMHKSMILEEKGFLFCD